MMTGWSRQGEGGAISSKHRIERRQSGVDSGPGCVPRAGTDRGRGVEAVLAEPRIDPLQCKCPAANSREGVGKGIAGPPSREPFVMGGLQEGAIVAAMDAQDGRVCVRGRSLCRADCGEDSVGAVGAVGGGVEAAVEEFRRWRVGALSLVPEAAHFIS